MKIIMATEPIRRGRKRRNAARTAKHRIRAMRSRPAKYGSSYQKRNEIAELAKSAESCIALKETGI